MSRALDQLLAILDIETLEVNLFRGVSPQVGWHGGSFSTRRVVAVQHGQAIFSMGASFHKHEEGLAHQMKMPDVPPPESLPSEAELKDLLFDRLPPQVKAYW